MLLQRLHARWSVRLAGLAFAAEALASSARAQPLADFYNHTPMTLVVGDATMTDPDFVAEATRAKMIIDPLDGNQIQALLNEAYAAPQPIRDRVAEYFLPAH